MLAALRSATSLAHTQLESATLGEKIMDGSLSPEEYTRIIDWQRRAHLALEPALAGFVGGQYQYRPRFSLTAPAAPAPALDRATAIGRLYVLEGSSLGGTMIYRQLQQLPALQPFAPFDFYRAQSEWGLKQWKSFVGFLKETTFTEEDIRHATTSALATFAEFERLWREAAAD